MLYRLLIGLIALTPLLSGCYNGLTVSAGTDFAPEGEEPATTLIAGMRAAPEEELGLATTIRYTTYPDETEHLTIATGFMLTVSEPIYGLFNLGLPLEDLGGAFTGSDTITEGGFIEGGGGLEWHVAPRSFDRPLGVSLYVEGGMRHTFLDDEDLTAFRPFARLGLALNY